MDREWHGRSREPEFWETLAERKPALGALCKGVKGMSMSESDGASCEGGGWLSTRLRALRAFSFPVSVLPMFVATAAVYPHSQWSWDVLAASVLGVMLLHAMGNLLNDYFDFSAGVDRKLDGDEGTFNMCTFWLVEALPRAGRFDRRRLEKARLIFEQMLGYANHLGLYAEETGPRGEALGNFPQAFTHLGLISAAFNLDRSLGARD